MVASSFDWVSKLFESWASKGKGPEIEKIDKDKSQISRLELKRRARENLVRPDYDGGRIKIGS